MYTEQQMQDMVRQALYDSERLCVIFEDGYVMIIEDEFESWWKDSLKKL